MGKKVAPIILGVAAGALSGGVGFSFATGFSFTAANAVGGAVVGGIISTAGALLTPSAPKPGDVGGFSGRAQKQTQTLRQAIVYRRKPVGCVVMGTVLTYYEATDNKKYHHMVMTVCDGPIDGFGTIWINDEPVNPEDIDGAGNVIRGRFKDKVRLKLHTGAAAQTADTDLVSETGVDSNFRGRGIAYIYARIQWNRDILPNGLPGFRCVVRAQETDPRTAVTGFNDNAALAWRSYVGDTTLGLGVHGADVSDVDATAFTAAANVCDEIADANDVTAAVEAVDVAGDTLALEADRAPFFIGDRVQVSSTGSNPGGLASATDFYVDIVNHARASADSPVRVRFATSLANLRGGTFVTITDAGSGDITVTKDGEPKYRASGVIDNEDAPYRIVEDLLSSMVGAAAYTGGKWVLLPGAWRAGSVQLGDKDIRGAISGPTRHSRRDTFNAVKGVYASPFQDGEPSEYPTITSAVLEAADDGERIYDVYDQPMTASPLQAQRCAGQRLKRHRTGEVQFRALFSMRAWFVRAGDNVLLTNARRGWTDKEMLVRAHRFVLRPTEDGVPYMACELDLQATLETDFQWDPATEETDVQPSARLTGTGIFDVTAPALGSVESGTDHLFVKADGSVVSRIYVPWTSVTDELIREGGQVQVRFRQTGAGDSAWQVRRQDDPTLDFLYLDPVEDGVGYDIQARAINGLGVPSDWSATTTHTVVGKTAAPSDVASLSASQNGIVVVFKWPQVTDLDLAGYEIRYMAAPFAWADATPLTEVTRGTQITSAGVPPGSWVFGIKARDTSENYSDTAATKALTVTNANDVVEESEQASGWFGTLSNLEKHWTGVLVPASTKAANLHTNAELFEQYVPYPEATCTYEAPALDLGFDADGVRVWADIVSRLGPGETSGTADPQLSIDYKDDAGSYDGFEDWSIGTADFRQLKAKITVDTSKGKPVIEGFNIVCDVAERTESGTLTVGTGGETITFASPFHNTPVIQVTPEGGLIPDVSNISTTSFDLVLRNTGGSAVEDDAGWTAEGA